MPVALALCVVVLPLGLSRLALAILHRRWSVGTLLFVPFALFRFMTRPAQYRSRMRLCALLLSMVLPRVPIQVQPSRSTEFEGQVVSESVNRTLSSVQSGTDEIGTESTKETQGSKENDDSPTLESSVFLFARTDVQFQGQRYRLIAPSLGASEKLRLFSVTVDRPRARAPPTRA
jgi:hypothetical protein